MLQSDVYVPGLQGSGPPPGANDDLQLVTHWYRKNSVAQVKTMATRIENRERMLMLTGQDTAFDGLLQGIYIYVDTADLNTALSDDASYIVVNDRRSAWRKIS